MSTIKICDTWMTEPRADMSQHVDRLDRSPATVTFVVAIEDHDGQRRNLDLCQACTRAFLADTSAAKPFPFRLIEIREFGR